MAEQKPTTEPTDVTSEPTTIPSGDQPRRLSPGNRWAIVGSSLAGLVFVSGMAGSIFYQADQAKAHQKLDGELAIEAAADGFKGVAEGTDYTGVDGRVYGTLQVNDDCNLQGVRIDYVKNADHVADITSYTVPLLMNGTHYQEKDRRHRTQDVIEGNIVEKHFTDLDSFTRAAGAMTCGAMDANLQLQVDADIVRAR